MISDYIKGKKQYDYPPGVQKGIKLHRAIDHFTDTHPVTQQLKSYFRPQYRLYAGAFADVVYDHFLANDINCFNTETDLKIFTSTSYQVLESFSDIFPLRYQEMFRLMKEFDWLYNYRYRWGIEKSFGGLVKRAAYLTESETAFDIFITNYNSMQVCYDNFFPDLEKFSTLQFHELINT